ncbi:MAG: ribosome biogenesis GTPase Der [Oligoflexia bacterium]|nr:ribosome biogenesis GTPase Der [Oligoflexia bacterium]
MNKRLKVAIIGRPNVGKSTLFNKITNTRKAVVKDEPGVTRDIHQQKTDWCGVFFDLYDTGGVTDSNNKMWNVAIKRQALKAAAFADKIIFVLDGKYGLNPEDRDLCIEIKKLNKPFLAVVNKIDDLTKSEMALLEFCALGLDNIIASSFEHKHNISDILDWIIQGEEKNIKEQETNAIKLAIVGKPNSGKSTLVNSLLGEERVVVSPIAGTTVDSIEIPFERDNQEYILVDTAGLRRGAKRYDQVEQISAMKTNEAIEDAGVIVLVIDSLLGPTHQDARIVEAAIENHKAVILAFNKIDLSEKEIPRLREKIRLDVENTFHFYRDIPVVFISAKTKKGIVDLFDKINKVWKQLNFRVSTREINDFFTQVIRQAPSPSFRGNDIKFYYITQTNQKPPSFMTFVNEPRGVTPSYRRFVVNKIKEHYDLKGIPVRIYAKKRTKKQIEKTISDTQNEAFVGGKF